MSAIINTLYFTLLSARATTWIRILAEMLMGVAFARGESLQNFSTFFLGFIAGGPLLWTAAYILNDITDIPYDREHELRKFRPLAQGIFPIKTAYLVVAILSVIAFSIAFSINYLFGVGLVILAISQILYTVPPFRYKEVRIVDIVLNGVNGGARFFLGYVAVTTDFTHFSFEFLVFAVLFKMFLFMGHRRPNRELEIKNGFKSTVASLKPNQLNFAIIFLFICSGLAYIFALRMLPVYSMVIPAAVFTVSLVPFLYRIHQGYLANQEKSLFWRVYLYGALLLFSISLYIVMLFYP